METCGCRSKKELVYKKEYGENIKQSMPRPEIESIREIEKLFCALFRRQQYGENGMLKMQKTGKHCGILIKGEETVSGADNSRDSNRNVNAGGKPRFGVAK